MWSFKQEIHNQQFYAKSWHFNLTHNPAFSTWIHLLPGNSPHKGQWRGALMFSFICAWIKCWGNNREAGNLRRRRVHYDVIVMIRAFVLTLLITSPGEVVFDFNETKFVWHFGTCLWITVHVSFQYEDHLSMYTNSHHKDSLIFIKGILLSHRKNGNLYTGGAAFVYRSCCIGTASICVQASIDIMIMSPLRQSSVTNLH